VADGAGDRGIMRSSAGCPWTSTDVRWCRSRVVRVPWRSTLAHSRPSAWLPTWLPNSDPAWPGSKGLDPSKRDGGLGSPRRLARGVQRCPRSSAAPGPCLPCPPPFAGSAGVRGLGCTDGCRQAGRPGASRGSAIDHATRCQLQLRDPVLRAARNLRKPGQADLRCDRYRQRARPSVASQTCRRQPAWSTPWSRRRELRDRAHGDRIEGQRPERPSAHRERGATIHDAISARLEEIENELPAHSRSIGAILSPPSISLASKFSLPSLIIDVLLPDLGR